MSNKYFPLGLAEISKGSLNERRVHVLLNDHHIDDLTYRFDVCASL